MLFEMISTRRRFGCLRVGRATPIRAVDCWRWPRSMTAARGVTRRGLAVSVCRRSVTGCCGSTHRGLVDGKAPGQAPKLNDAQRQALARIVESGPIPAAHGVVRWRLIDLAPRVWEAFGVSIAKQAGSGARWACASDA